MKRTLAALAAALLTAAAASAQTPDDQGNGTRLGIQELNTSGQVGDVTLFAADPNTRVAVRIDGARGREAVRIYRGQSCENVSDATGRPAYVLSNLNPSTGFSRTVVHATGDKLLSGNYNVIVFSSAAPGARPVACGHLYR